MDQQFATEKCERCDSFAEYYIDEKCETAFCKKCCLKIILTEFNVDHMLTEDEKLRKGQIDEFLGQVDNAKKN